MPVTHCTYWVQGTLVQTMVTDGSVLPYRFVSIVGPMRVGRTRPGLLGIGVMVSPGPSDGGNGLVQSMGLAKVVADAEVFSGDPVCVSPDGGIVPLAMDLQSVGTAVEGGERGSIVRVWLNISSDFMPSSHGFARMRLRQARRAVGDAGKDGDGQEFLVGKRKRYVSLDG